MPSVPGDQDFGAKAAAVMHVSKIDGWLAAVLGLSMAACAYACVHVVLAGVPGAWWMVLLTGGIGVGLPLWLLLGTRYILEPDQLLVRSGPFRWRVPIADIARITPTTNPLSSPALSLDRLRIEYGRGSAIMISPRDKDRFLRDLEELRRTGRGSPDRVDSRSAGVQR